MSVINRLPDNTRVRYPVARFESSVLDGLGRYNWSTNAAAQNVTWLTELNPPNVYLIERVNFFANVDEGDWLSSMMTAADFPRIQLHFTGLGGRSIYTEPFRCVNFIDNSEQMIFFESTQKIRRGAPVNLEADMNGQVQQVPAMVGRATLLAQFNATIYEITDARWIETFKKDPGKLALTWRD